MQAAASGWLRVNPKEVGRCMAQTFQRTSIFIAMLNLLIRRSTALLPSSCSVCHAWGSQAICPSCLHAFALSRKRCATCALPLHFDSDAGQARVLRCGACLSLGSQLDACYAAVDYAYPWDRLIQRLKYSDGGDLRAQPALAASMAWVTRHVAQSDTDLAAGLLQASRCDWIIPVALHPDRQRERGFNQALALARALFPGHARIRSDLLMRIKKTAVQADLPRDARANNLRAAFIAAPLTAASLKQTHVMLIDDVTTTSATLNAAAQALRQAGATQVSAWVFARTVS
jgi:ComF family protein